MNNYLVVANLVQQLSTGQKVFLTNTNVLLCKRDRTIARIKEKEPGFWIHPQKLCHLNESQAVNFLFYSCEVYNDMLMKKAENQSKVTTSK